MRGGPQGGTSDALIIRPNRAAVVDALALWIGRAILVLLVLYFALPRDQAVALSFLMAGLALFLLSYTCLNIWNVRILI